MSSPRINWWIAFIAIWFWLIETAYFGWNASPGSDAELICDGLALLIFAIAIAAGRPPRVNVEVLKMGDRMIARISGDITVKAKDHDA